MIPRKILEEKTTAELHDLLAQTFDEGSEELPDVDLIHTILDILEAREPYLEELDVEEARATFCEKLQMILEEEGQSLRII